MDADSIASAETGRPWWKICCAGCLLLFLGFFIALVITIRAVTGPGTQRLSALPAGYPTDLKPYRLEEASSIEYLPGASKGKLMEAASYPLRWFGGSTTTEQATSGVKTYARLLQTTDRITITWEHLSASRDDVLRAYSELFKKTGMTDQASTDEATGVVVDMAERDDAVVQLSIQDVSETPDVDRIVLTIDYIPKS